MQCAERAVTELGTSNASFYPATIDFETFAGPATFLLLHANASYNPQAWNWTRVVRVARAATLRVS